MTEHKPRHQRIREARAELERRDAALRAEALKRFETDQRRRDLLAIPGALLRGLRRVGAEAWR